MLPSGHLFVDVFIFLEEYLHILAHLTIVIDFVRSLLSRGNEVPAVHGRMYVSNPGDFLAFLVLPWPVTKGNGKLQ